MNLLKRMSIILLAAGALIQAQAGSAMGDCVEPTMGDYTVYPVFQANTVEPNIFLVVDNSGSMNYAAYTEGYDHATRYYGYFEPYKRYTYRSGVFYRDETGAWDGNFLNWAVMRRVDVIRKVLMGGLATSRTGGGNQTNYGEDASSAYSYLQDYGQWTGTEAVPASVSPCPSGKRFYFYLTGDDFLFRYWDGDSWEDVGEASYSIRIKKGEDIDGNGVQDEDYNFLDGNLAGVMQRLWDRGRFGLEVFNEGSDDKSRQNGGLIPRVVGSSTTDMVNSIQNQACNTWTPLAEAYYTAIKYFEQEDVEPELDYANNVIPNDTAAQDPYNNPDPVHCASSFVLLLTDGASTKDLYIPDGLKDYDGDGDDGVTTVDSSPNNDGSLDVREGDDLFSTTAEGVEFDDSYVGLQLVLYDTNDIQVYSGAITAVESAGELWVSGSTDTPEWRTGAPYTEGFYWKITAPVPNNEGGIEAGSNYLDDLALYARINDLRDDLDGDQNLYLYCVYAFGSDPSARNLLKNAAKQGGFEDKNGNRQPDLEEEWDADGDGVPDTFYDASNGYQLESQLLRAFNDILQRAASGTAVSVLATSSEGEGNLVQAYFRPSVTSGLNEITWVGYLQSVWTDEYGNLREDTDGDLTLDVTTDRVISYFHDSNNGDSKIKRFEVSDAEPFPDTEEAEYEVIELEEINPLWEAGSLLAERSADDRLIFTYVDMDKDGVLDDPGDDPFDGLGEAVRFASDVEDVIKPYLGVRDNATWDYLGETQDDRVHNLIEYIRGNESDFTGTGTMFIRSRELDGQVWKLGDIVNSTPVSISRPPDNYHAIYSDRSYQDYYDAYKDRETVVYTGANDGMLHAFTSWRYDRSSDQYVKPAGADADEEIGDELWAYIPQSVLPHLKWLPYPDYTHTYYVDLKPKVFDAKIFPDDTHYVDDDTEPNWGTVLLLGLNMGGKEICVEDWFDDGTGEAVYETRTFYPSYAALDVTDPRDPKLLWERTFKDLGMTTSYPAVVKVGEKWFAVFGSGPETYNGASTTTGKVFVVDIATGEAYPNLSEFDPDVTDAWLFETSESNAFMNSPVSLDKELNYNVDAVYFGETYMDKTWKGKVYKISIPWDWFDDSTYSDDPNDLDSPWTFSTLFSSPAPITSQISLSLDRFDNVWVYFGTGRYLSDEDKIDTQTQYLFGLVDPFFNAYYDQEPEDYFHNYSKSKTLDFDLDLFNADPYLVTTSGNVYDTDYSYFGSWSDLLAEARTKDGWRRTLLVSGERSLERFTILGGIAFAPTFVPNDDVCEFGGDSYLYGLYFETGTPYWKSVFDQDTETMIVQEDGENVEYERLVGRVFLGSGKSSSVGIHVGHEEGAKAFIQQSTGTVVEEVVTPAFKIKSGLVNWREK